MRVEKTPIIPYETRIFSTGSEPVLNKEAICVFLATGFFLDTDTYFTNKIVLPPAANHTIDDAGNYSSSTPWFNWSYKPRNISFNTALDEFTDLFESIIAKQVGEDTVILPLSGGLDSRTQAAALK